MFYYINPGFKTDLGHHLAHQAELWNVYKNEFCVVSNENLDVNNLPYHVIKLFKSDTWEYLEQKKGIKDFYQSLEKLNDQIKDGDTLFMYMSDLLFLLAFIRLIKEGGHKLIVILNLFHSGKYFLKEGNTSFYARELLIATRDIRKAFGISLLVEGEDIQEKLFQMTNERISVMPMIHQKVNVCQPDRKFCEVPGKMVISFVSATVERGFFPYLDLIRYIEKEDPQLLVNCEFRIRLHFEDPVYTENIKQINPLVSVSFGMLISDDYCKFIEETDILLLPYLSEHFFGRSSGIFSEAIINEIPVVSTNNTWNGAYTAKYNIGEVFDENDCKSFYTKLKKVISDYTKYKNNLSVTKQLWDDYHKTGQFEKILEDLRIKPQYNIEDIEGIYSLAKQKHDKFENYFSAMNRRNHYSELALVSSYPFNQNKGLKSVLVDVGAHEGGVTAKFANKDWEVLAFEPEESNRTAFEERHGKNPNIICVPKAVTNRTGDKIPFYTSDKHFGIHSIMPFHDTHHRATYEVETTTLRDALKQNSIDHVSFLKVDTEGADFLALKGFDWEMIKPELVMVEFMDDRSVKNFNYTHHDMARYMEEKDYTCFVSEWGPIKEYGIKGKKGQPHEWLRCVPYPLDHVPSWGNLIFVPKTSKNKFKRTLKAYLRSLRNKRSNGPKKSLLLKTKMFIKKTFFN